MPQKAAPTSLMHRFGARNARVNVQAKCRKGCVLVRQAADCVEKLAGLQYQFHDAVGPFTTHASPISPPLTVAQAVGVFHPPTHSTEAYATYHQGRTGVCSIHRSVFG